jgi:hypothetical protein
MSKETLNPNNELREVYMSSPYFSKNIKNIMNNMYDDDKINYDTFNGFQNNTESFHVGNNSLLPDQRVNPLRIEAKLQRELTAQIQEDIRIEDHEKWEGEMIAKNQIVTDLRSESKNARETIAQNLEGDAKANEQSILERQANADQIRNDFSEISAMGSNLVKDMKGLKENFASEDVIDDDGNLLMNNNEISPSIRDGLLKDNRETLIVQNNMYIIGTIATTSLIVALVIMK